MILLFLILAIILIGCVATSMYETKQVVSAYEDMHHQTYLNELRKERQEICLIRDEILEIKLLVNDITNK